MMVVVDVAVASVVFVVVGAVAAVVAMVVVAVTAHVVGEVEVETSDNCTAVIPSASGSRPPAF